jgi:glutamate N-acetyltransferase/amino-acid N-acetyltransferase
MAPKGYKFSAVEAAIKKPGRLDLALIFSEKPAQLAAVFTTNKVKAAPVILSEERAKSGICQAILVNSGNANACTGRQGMDDARETARLVAEGLGIPDESVQVSSTGVIGVPLPMERFRSAMPRLLDSLGDADFAAVANAIMTTDTSPKLVSREGEADGVKYSIEGIAKGAGMIMPNMATMLAFVITDAALAPDMAANVLGDGVERSFNIISVDGDTSTNDTALLLANGAAGNAPIASGTPAAARFKELLDEVLLELAKLIVKDGEGASKFVAIRVKGAASTSEARQAAMAIANSSLVKTAFFGQDANWGRIFAAVGYSGVTVEQERLALWFDDILMAKDGIFAGGDAEARGSAVLKQKEFAVTVDMGIGSGEATVYTSDLSYDYVKINADYRT